MRTKDQAAGGAIADTAAEPDTGSTPSGPVWLLRDSWTEATRHLRALPRNPDVLAFSTIQPVMFLLLFAYVFGGSISVPGFTDYKQFLMPGIFAQTMLFGSSFTAVGLAEDLQKGIADRLRSLPMYQAGVLLGRTWSDVIRNMITFAVMMGVSLAIGFRIRGTMGEALAATLLLLSFSYAFSWMQGLFGASVGSVEAANSASFIWIFPITFVSSAFVDPANMPGWMQPIARNNPFTIVTNATRALYNGYSPGNDLWIAMLWTVAITAVFSALALRKFVSR